MSKELEEAIAKAGIDKAEEIPLRVILESNGIQDAIWALRAAEQTEEHQRKCRLFAIWCARQVQPLTDPRSINALDVAERHANGEATDKDLDAARLAAWQAARADAWQAAMEASMAAARAAVRKGAGDDYRQAQADKFIEMFCS